MKYSLLIPIIILGIMPIFVSAQITTESTSGDQTTTSVNPGNSTTAAAATTPTIGIPNDGIMSCNQTSAYAMSVGSLSATASVYVPTNDAAVTLNTGYLTYLACVLRPMVDALRKNATANMVGQIGQKYLTGNNGAPMFSQNQAAETQAQQLTAAVPFFQYANTQINPSYAQNVVSSIARQYRNQINNPYGNLVCNTPVTDSTSLWSALSTYMNNSACYPLGAYDNAQADFQALTDGIANNINTQLDRGQGTYPTYDSNGNIVTPGSIINAITQQALTSGFRQTESANDIGQMVGSLFTGMGAQILNNISGQGLVGLASGSGGTTSYFNQVSQDASQGVTGSVSNAALQTLTGVRQIESAYYQTLAQVATNLTTSAKTVQSVEAQCWVVLIPKVVSYACTSTTTTPVYNGNTVTCYTANKASLTLTIATSTDASTAIINAQIQPTANTLISAITASQKALDNIDALISSVSNNTSSAAQAQAISQFNYLVSQNAFHTQNDVSNLTPEVKQINDSMTQLLGSGSTPGTLQTTWYGINSDGTQSTTAVGTPGDPNSAWCDTANPATLAAWAQKWSK